MMTRLRKLFLSLTLVLPFCVQSVRAGTPGLKADTVKHDFGKIEQSGTYRAAFRVEAEADVVVFVSASTNCGCTKAAYPKKPLRKGGTGTIEVTFEAKDKGVFDKKVKVTYNAGGSTYTLELTIMGSVS